MLNLALWLKRNGFRADQVQTFLPSPMATATAMYHTGRNPLRKRAARGRRDGVRAQGACSTRRLHKAFLRYHDPENWPLLREALRRMGRADLIGGRPHQLIPLHQPVVPEAAYKTGSEKRSTSSAETRPFRTQQTVNRPRARPPTRATDRARRRDRPGR